MTPALLALVGMLGSFLPQPVVSGNFPRDLYGPVDTRADCWGHADSATLDIQFYPPAGYGVFITSLTGDLIAFPKTDQAIPGNRYAGVLVGTWATGTDGTAPCDFCAPGYNSYAQDAISTNADKTRAAFAGTSLTLGSDNVLHLKIAEFLNTMGVPIHLEATYTIRFAWVAL